MTDSTWYVYRLFDSEDRLLYVGCTRYPEQRMGQHRRNGSWGCEIDESKTAVVPCISEQVALDHEKALIHTFSPPHNRRDNLRYRPQLQQPRRITLKVERQLHYRLVCVADIELEIPLRHAITEAIEQWLDRTEAELKAKKVSV